MSYQLDYSGQEVNERLQLFDLIYPIGSIYMSVSSTSPATLFGGTWEQIEDTFLLAAGSSYEAGAVGGEVTHTLTTEEMPEHTHTRGTMDITGTFTGRPHYTGDSELGGALTSSEVTGAFELTIQGGANTDTGTSEYNSSKTIPDDLMDFQASRSWTGETSLAGESAAHNNMPPYLAVYMWKRIA